MTYQVETGGGTVKLSADKLDGEQMLKCLAAKLKYFTPQQVEAHPEKLRTREDPR